MRWHHDLVIMGWLVEFVIECVISSSTYHQLRWHHDLVIMGWLVEIVIEYVISSPLLVWATGPVVFRWHDVWVITGWLVEFVLEYVMSSHVLVRGDWPCDIWMTWCVGNNGMTCLVRDRIRHILYSTCSSDWPSGVDMSRWVGDMWMKMLRILSRTQQVIPWSPSHGVISVGDMCMTRSTCHV